MKYKTELHCHTNEISPCSSETPVEVAEKYIANGYTTLVVTNHASTWICDVMLDSAHKSWEEQINTYFDAIDNVRATANGELNVLYGMEIRFTAENNNDYLVFGITREFCLANPDIFTMGYRAFHNLCKENGLIFIQAHPFRFGMTTIEPDCVDGYEVFNGHFGQRSHNGVAQMWAEHFTKHNIIMTSGTDNHYQSMTPNAGIITDEPITSGEQLVEILRSGKYELIRSPLGDVEY